MLIYLKKDRKRKDSMITSADIDSSFWFPLSFQEVFQETCVISTFIKFGTVPIQYVPIQYKYSSNQCICMYLIMDIHLRNIPLHMLA